MGGMDMGTQGMFAPTNMSIARAYWYIVAGTVGVLTSRRIFEESRSYLQRRSRRHGSESKQSQPLNVVAQTYETTVAICREMAYPQLYWLNGRVGRYFNPPPLGRCLVLLTYWAIILTMLWTNTILAPSNSMYAYKWEIVGFRAAWVSITQVPLIYCLSCKFNVISIATGISYERLNWLHRWVSRTLFLTVIVHWSYFFEEWVLAEFVTLELQIMPMVKYGFGAWAVTGWMVLTGFGFVRNLAYELWVLQHLLAAYMLIWLLYQHVPAYARYNLWLAIAFVAFDRGTRFFLSLSRNSHFTPRNLLRGIHIRRLGFPSSVEHLPHGYVRLTIEDADFKWRPGQHIFICVPRYGFVESHPFTIATPSPPTDTLSHPLQIYMKVHGGLTRKLHQHAQKRPHQKLQVFVSGPWGQPPLTEVAKAETLILFATSTGASFTIPNLFHALKSPTPPQRVSFMWVVRRRSQLRWYSQQLEEAFRLAEAAEVTLDVKIYITKDEDEKMHALELTSSRDTSSSSSSSTHEKMPLQQQPLAPLPTKSKNDDTTTSTVKPASTFSSSSTSSLFLPHSEPTPITPASTNPSITLYAARPSSLDPLIRPLVEDTRGETCILACGKPQFMAEIRNYVAALSDERAVHKGTGAQGIYVFTESYGW